MMIMMTIMQKTTTQNIFWSNVKSIRGTKQKCAEILSNMESALMLIVLLLIPKKNWESQKEISNSWILRQAVWYQPMKLKSIFESIFSSLNWNSTLCKDYLFTIHLLSVISKWFLNTISLLNIQIKNFQCESFLFAELTINDMVDKSTFA
jgi:hypothetical protein